jgi:hypothetical protein
MRPRALCDKEDPMLTRSCSSPYVHPPLTKHLSQREYQDTKKYTYSSSAFPALVSPRSGTFRTAARGPGTRWTSGTDRVRDLPTTTRRAMLENQLEQLGRYGVKIIKGNSRLLTFACSDGPRPPPHRIPTWTNRPSDCPGWLRAQQWLEGELFNTLG